MAAPFTSMLKTTMSSQVLAVNEILGVKVLVANEAGDVGGCNRSNDGSKHVEPKTGKLAKFLKSPKSGNSKG